MIFLLLLLLPLLAAVPADSFDAFSVSNVLTAVQECRSSSNPALAVTVVKDGQVLLSRGFGVTAIGGGGGGGGSRGGAEAVTSSTRFNIASLTKAFTSTLLLKVMEEDGRYNLSTKVREVLGEDLQFVDDVRTKEATVEDLLSHKVAIPSDNRLRFNNNVTRANLKDRLKYLQTPYAFRNVYIYSNLMYGLATRMTEVIGGAGWEDLVRRHLYEPLGMNRSTFVRDVTGSSSSSSSSSSTGVARAYRLYFGDLKPVSPHLPFQWSELAGSGSVVSTADDMARWMNFHLSKGQGPEAGKRVMTESTMEQLYKPRTAMDKSPLSKFRQPDVPVTFTYDVYGLGFRNGYYRGYPIVGHGGSSFGYRSLLTLMPSQRLGVFTVMSGGDTSYRTRGTLHAYLMDRALQVPSPWLNTSTLCSFPAPWHNVTSKTWPPYDVNATLAHSVSAYVGLYEHPAYGTFEVRAWQPSGSSDDGREPAAPLTLFYGFATWDLIPLSSSSSSSAVSPSTAAGGEAFYGKGRNVTAWIDYSPFVFHAPPNGSEVIVEMSAPGLEKRSPRVFTRIGAKKTSRASVCGVYVPLLLLVCLAAFFMQ
ncbi:uncharacterized protein LOC143297148 [Babylonia areolata]|uniref:uncharacterized protein LOC143297148 n=1 Tax=Babylonia areolata TaxID=304850 RepID=UPI003FD3F0A7